MRGGDNANPVFEYSRADEEDDKESLERDMEEDEISPLHNPRYTIAAEYHSWNYIKEISDNFAGLSEDTEYYFYLEAAPNKNCGVIFCYIIMMLVEDKNKDRNIIMPS